MTELEKPLCAAPLKPDEKAKLQLRLSDLLKFLNAPGDWGYDTELGDFTLAALRVYSLVNKA